MGFTNPLSHWSLVGEGTNSFSFSVSTIACFIYLSEVLKLLKATFLKLCLICDLFVADVSPILNP